MDLSSNSFKDTNEIQYERTSCYDDCFKFQTPLKQHPPKVPPNTEKTLNSNLFSSHSSRSSGYYADSSTVIKPSPVSIYSSASTLLLSSRFSLSTVGSSKKKTFVD